MTLGKFAVRERTVLRESTETGNEVRDFGEFKRFVERVEAGDSPHPVGTRKVADERPKLTNGNAKNYALIGTGVPGSFPTRWPGCSPPADPCTGSATVSVSFQHTSAGPGGGIAAGLAAWTNDPGSFITLTDGGNFAGS